MFQFVPIIKRAFERYAEGNLTIDDMRNEFYIDNAAGSD